MLSAEEIEFYQNQITLPDIDVTGQETIKTARVLVIGTGGLGCPALSFLAAAGVGTLGIVDYDIVQRKNLHRQILFTENDIGRPKVEAAREKLLKSNPYIEVNAYNTTLNPDNALSLIGEYDMVVDATDNFSTRYLINDACVILDKPMIYGAVVGFSGHLPVFNYRNGPTYRCLIPEEVADNNIPDCSSAGILGAVSGVIGSMQALECIKIIVGLSCIFSGILLQWDALSMTFDKITVELQKKNRQITSLGHYPDIHCNENEFFEISANELKQMIDNRENIQIICLSERYTGLFPKNICRYTGFTELVLNPENVERDKKTVIVCEIGIKSREVVKAFNRQHKLENVYSLRGGVNQLKLLNIK